MRRLIVGGTISAIACTGVSLVTAGTASASTLPTQAKAAQQSLATASVESKVSAAFAESIVASTTTRSATISAVVRPATVNDCYTWLNSQDYPVTVPRAIACFIAGLGKPTVEAAIGSCTVALVATKVDPANATFACTLAAVPG